MARSIGFSLSKSSSLARSFGFHPSKNSSLARPIGFHPSKLSSLASSSLIACRCRPMEIIGGNCYSLAMTTYSTSTVPTSRQFPWLMLAPEESNVYRFYSLLDKDVKEVVVESSEPPPQADSHCLGQSFKGWMGYIRHKDCQVFVFNPHSGKKIYLPTVDSIPSVKRVIRNSQSGLVEGIISRHSAKPLAPQKCYKGLIGDVVLSSSPMDDDCIAVVCCYGMQLAFCRITTNCWIPLHSPFRIFEQIVYHSGRKLFYTISNGERTFQLEAWDLHSDPIKRFHIEDQSQVWRQLIDWNPVHHKEKGLDSDDIDRRIYLAYDHQRQELFIVMRHVVSTGNILFYYDGEPQVANPGMPNHKTMSFDVFKVDFLNDHLVNVQHLNSIGNRTFFVGKDRAFVLSRTKFSKLRAGCIYFADDLYDWHYSFGAHDMGIYVYEEDSIHKIKSILPAHSWFIPDVDA